METKSLYTILGIRPDASPDQIESAYAELLHLLKDGSESNPGGDDRIRLMAAKEAHTVLSNPISRQQYNQKLLAPGTIDNTPEIIMVESSSSWGILKLLIFGTIVIAAIWTYNQNTIEKEKLRVQHEKEMQENQIKLDQAQLRQQRKLEAEERDRLLREKMVRESRELDYRLAQEAREQESKQQQALREQQSRVQQEESRRRQQQYEAERQIEKEKMAVQRLQNENRRNGYRYY